MKVSHLFAPAVACRPACLSLALATLLANAPAAEPWPQQNGATGNYAPLPSDARFLDDLSTAKQVWLSETTDLGYGKGSASGYLQNLARWDGHPGSCSAPIVAGGKIFVTTFRPSGEAWAENLPQYQQWVDAIPKPDFTKEQVDRMLGNLRILADDLLVAIDLETGKTAWVAVEEGAGINRYMGKRQGYCVSPAYHDGAVFSLGTSGLLRAYRATDGKQLWEVSLGVARDEALQLKEDSLKKRTLAGGMGWDSSLVVADGVLVVPLFEGGQDLGLRGVDPASGETLWEFPAICSRHATPAVWTHADRQYVLSATVTGKLQLIDPRAGKLRWTVDGLGANHCSLIATGEHALVNIGTAIRRDPESKREDYYARIGAYALGPDKATFAWALADSPSLYYSTWMDNCARRFIAAADGKVYYNSIGTEKGQQRLNLIDASDGRLLAQVPLDTPAPLFYPLGDRLLMIRDASHGETDLAMFSTDPKDFRQLAEFWHPPHQGTTAYEVAMECPIAAGKIYIRTRDGRIACYGLHQATP